MFSTRALLKGASALALTFATGASVARAAESEPSAKVELVIVTAERRAVDCRRQRSPPRCSAATI